MHKKNVIVDGRMQEKKWEVDVRALGNLRNNDWIGEFPQLLRRDLDEMQRAFPHWFLAVGNGTTPAVCENDRDFIVPADGEFRCLKCGQIHSKAVTSLIWIGMLPVQITGANRVEERIRDMIRRSRIAIVYVDQGQALYVLPMIKVIYPSNWPRSAPDAHYFPGFFDTIGVSVTGASHSNHMNSESKMCLFSNWNQMSICEVIQNRIAPHALAQVKIANGERPQRWFN